MHFYFILEISLAFSSPYYFHDMQVDNSIPCRFDLLSVLLNGLNLSVFLDCISWKTDPASLYMLLVLK